MTFREAPSVLEFAKILFPSGRGHRLMAMLGGHFDETGNDKKAKLLIVAGCIAPAPQWGKFERKWLSVLGDAGLPRTRPFHMTDFVARKSKPYSEWTDAKCEKITRDLVGALKDHVILMVVSAMEKDGYRKFCGDFGRPIKEAQSAYAFCATRCLAQTARWTKANHYEEKIAYVFEDGNLPKVEVGNVHKAIKGNDRLAASYRAHSVSFADKKECVPLQSADFVAWEAQRFYHAHYKKSARSAWRKSLQALFKGIPFCDELIDYDQLVAKHTEHQKEAAKRPVGAP